jgi:DNA-3-methyladenine glycosylase
VALPLRFYDRPTCDVAVDLLGRRLVTRAVAPDGTTRIRAGRIVETEAYVGPDDLACHAARGRTARTEVMFGPPGRAYVYLIYGMYHCLNAVTEREGFPAAVLIRALEPEPDPEAGLAARTSGPGLLCRALRIDRTFNGERLDGPRIAIESGDRPADEPQPCAPVAAGPRVGVAYAGEWAARPWRYWLDGNRWVSKRVPSTGL